MSYLPPRGNVYIGDVNADEIVTRLRDAGCVFAEDEAALLVAEAASDEQLDAWLGRRETGEPLEQILGWAEFRGLRIALEPGVFVPRFRTEFLVECALEIVRPGDVVVDLCCGSGAIGAALFAAEPGIDLFASDVDPAAVASARRNLPTGRVFEGDLFDALPLDLRADIDLMVVNAPYVPTDVIPTMPPEARDHEHLVALDGGDDGLDFHCLIAAQVGEWLKAGGTVVIETSEAQAERTADLFRAVGMNAEVRHSDEYEGTVVIAR